MVARYLIISRHGYREDAAVSDWLRAGKTTSTKVQEYMETRKRPFNAPLAYNDKDRIDSIARSVLETCSIDRIFCSPFCRCLQTAKQYMDTHSVMPCRFNVHFGLVEQYFEEDFGKFASNRPFKDWFFSNGHRVEDCVSLGAFHTTGKPPVVWEDFDSLRKR